MDRLDTRQWHPASKKRARIQSKSSQWRKGTVVERILCEKGTAVTTHTATWDAKDSTSASSECLVSPSPKQKQ